MTMLKRGGAVGQRMRAFYVAGGEEFPAVSWREGHGVEMGGYGFVRDLAKDKMKRKLRNSVNNVSRRITQLSHDIAWNVWKFIHC